MQKQIAMPAFGRNLVLASCLVAVGCVQGAENGPNRIGFTPVSGLPDEAVLRMAFLNDNEGRDMRTIYVTYIPEKATKAQIDALPTRLCASMGRKSFFSEYLVHQSYHLGMRTEKLMVRCDI